MPLTLTSREIRERTGLSARKVQTWTERGVLLADDQRLNPGRGANRQFAPVELDVAKFLASLDHDQMSVAEAASLAAYVREIFTVPSQYDFVLLNKDGSLRMVAEIKHQPSSKRSRIEAWAQFEAAKRSLTDPVMLLCRQRDGSWQHQFIAGSADKNALATKPNTRGWSAGYVVALRNVLKSS